MITGITVGNRTIFGLKKINMFVGHPKTIGDFLYAVRRIPYASSDRYIVCEEGVKFTGIAVLPNFASDMHFSELPDALLRSLYYNKDLQLFLTTQSLDLIQAYHEVVMSNADYADYCTFMRLGRSALDDDERKIIATFFDREKLGRFLTSDIEVR